MKVDYSQRCDQLDIQTVFDTTLVESECNLKCYVSRPNVALSVVFILIQVRVKVCLISDNCFSCYAMVVNVYQLDA